MSVAYAACDVLQLVTRYTAESFYLNLNENRASLWPSSGTSSAVAVVPDSALRTRTYGSSVTPTTGVSAAGILQLTRVRAMLSCCPSHAYAIAACPHSK